MATKTVLTTLDTERGEETRAVDNGRRRLRANRRVERRTVRRAALILAAGCALAFLFPAIAAPVNGDDRYWYLWIGARADWSFAFELQRAWGDLTIRAGYGRLNVLTGLERRLVGKAVFEAALATGTPFTVYQALLKLLLVGAGIGTVLAFVRSLRWRAADGRLVRAGRRTLLLAGVAGLLGVAVGAQAHNEATNGWTAYPWSTYGAVIFIFGPVAMLVWLARLIAQRSTARTLVAVTVLIMIGAATNFRYELVFPALPVAAIALAVVPVTDLANRSAGIRAKLIAGLAYFGGFVPVFLAIRLHLAGVCKRQECYDGVQVALGKDAVRASVYNLLSAVPGSGGNELRVQLLEVGWDRVYPVDPTAWSMLLGLGALVALLALWWTVPHARYAGGVGLPDPRSTERAEGVVLGLAAGLSLLVALGTAIIMGISPRSHELVTEPGVLYRNAVVTWTGLVFGVVLAVLALGKILPRPGGLAAWATLAVAIALVGTLALPGNLLALRANRVLLEVSEAINWEVVRGDTAPGGDERRCDLFERARLGVGGTGSRDRLYTHANTAFKTHYGQPFCSRPGFPEDPQ